MERPGSRLAWVIAAGTASLAVAGLTLLFLTLDHPPQGDWGFRGFPIIFALAAGPLGWLIMRRRPENRIGVLMSLSGVLSAAQLFLTEYAAAGTRLSLPASNVAALVNAFIWVPGVTVLAGAIPLVFPDGHLPSPRWRPVVWLTVVSVVLLCAIIIAFPGAIDTARVVRRDFRLPIADATLNQAAYVVLIGLGTSFVASGASLFLRWRGSQGVVREQLKWLALSIALVVTTMWVSVIPSPATAAIFIAAIATVPLAVGIAVLRYRLYEIDAVISRTLVFGALTAILTGAFAALLKLLQTVFVAVTGNESDAATIITTLVLATAFAPLKKALEKLAERRFGDHLADPGAASLVATQVQAGDVGVSAGHLEALLRRVVREELNATRSEIEGGPGSA
jgi:hypothetical protein